MASCRETWKNLLLQIDEGIIDDEEFLLLWEINKRSNLHFPVHDYPRFDLESKDEIEWNAEFLFEE
jgi:hypothetical protein